MKEKRILDQLEGEERAKKEAEFMARRADKETKEREAAEAEAERIRLQNERMPNLLETGKSREQIMAEFTAM